MQKLEHVVYLSRISELVRLRQGLSPIELPLRMHKVSRPLCVVPRWHIPLPPYNHLCFILLYCLFPCHELHDESKNDENLYLNMYVLYFIHIVYDLLYSSSMWTTVAYGVGVGIVLKRLRTISEFTVHQENFSHRRLMLFLYQVI